MENNAEFVEKQYFGRDHTRISIRLTLILFCFAAYWITEEREHNGDLFLVAGFAILIISIIIMFMLHYRTVVRNGSIFIDGLWTTRLVKIDLAGITKVERVPYNSYIINNPVYNLHQKGKIRFYAGGRDAVSLIDRDGLEYIIGTQRPVELEQAIKKEMRS